MIKQWCMLVACCAITGCGGTQEGDGAPVDDPANTALRGAWSIETRISSIEYNGMRFSPAAARAGGDLADIIGHMERPVELACTEPSLVRSNQPNDSYAVACFAGDTSGDADQEPMCIGDDKATLRVDGSIGVDSGQVTVTIVPAAGGQRDTDRMTFAMTRTLRRTGDCSATP
jgi:hypothetical protein